MNFHPSSEIYDAIVVGAGATGGIAAKELSDRGLSVLVLDAGPQLTPAAAAGNPIRNMARRFENLAIAHRQSHQALHPGYWKANPDLFVNEQENPYTTPADRPFFWIRGRQVGGRSLTWGGITLRFSDYEFKASRYDGFGEDWPLSYDELAPYYDHLEKFLRVRGARDGLPQLPDGHYLPAAAFTPAEEHLRQVVATHWPTRSMIISRGFSLHKPTPEQPWSPASSLGSSLKVALQSGKVHLQPDAVVSHVMFDPAARQAKGVGYIHRLKKTAHEVRGRLVVLAASTIESVRILLHSTEKYQPGGLTNPSGLLGRYLMDHLSTMVFFTLPGRRQPLRPFELSGCHSFFIPRFCNLAAPSETFLRGYGIWGGIQRFPVLPWMQKLGQDAFGFMVGHGEVLPNPNNCVQLDSTIVDAWGIPVAHIDTHWTDNERQMLAHIQQQIRTLVDLAGGICPDLPDWLGLPFLSQPLRRLEQATMTSPPPGFYIHEVGGARMGTSPNNSVLNSSNQVWETPNLLVVDGACWPTAGWQSPTLTEMAIAARACDLWVKNLRS